MRSQEVSYKDAITLATHAIELALPLPVQPSPSDPSFSYVTGGVIEHLWRDAFKKYKDERKEIINQRGKILRKARRDLNF